MATERPFRRRMALGVVILVLSTGVGAEAVSSAAAVRLIGRAERGAGVWRVTWPAVSWRTAFSGSRVGVGTQDAAGYSVTIDGTRRNQIAPSETRQTTWYRGLTAGNHTIEVTRMVGTPLTPGLFFGFNKGANGRWLPLPSRLSRQIEFIADSGSTGYGDLSSTVDCTDEDVESRSDASQSYAVIAAHELHADWQLNAMNGIGVVRNWHGIWRGTSYATYASRTLQSDSASHYQDSNWHPQVAVVRIGSNDFGSPLGTDEPWTAAQLELEFADSYRTLLAELRGRLGPGGLIIVVRPAFGENPANAKVSEIVDSLRLGGDQRLYELQFPELELTGCNFHPSLSDHRLMSAALVKFIESHESEDSHWTPSANHLRSRSN